MPYQITHPLRREAIPCDPQFLRRTLLEGETTNTVRLGEAVRKRKRAGLPVEPELLAHISPLGWGHILLTGEYRWPKQR